MDTVWTRKGRVTVAVWTRYGRGTGAARTRPYTTLGNGYKMWYAHFATTPPVVLERANFP